MKPTTICIDAYCEECSEEVTARVAIRGPHKMEILVEPCDHCMDELASKYEDE